MKFTVLSRLKEKIENVLRAHGTADHRKSPREGAGHAQPASLLADLRGRECVYIEPGFIRIATVSGIESDDWGIRLAFVMGEGLDCGPGEDRMWEASAAWECISVTERSISAANVGWTLVVRADLIEKIRSAASGKSDKELLIYVYRLLMGHEDLIQ